ncbi:protein-disulfide isomerase [Sphingomonas spermidinifaciens]|uniref:Protein-disulfide isomerase n=1 Tax=Sphingomonas spermidinifaciens TaxID=1141889 RepID=A0A2A4B955_9SPHN|nr:thioredoxin domain-containing protein [Sphingomonas spermidinifaciens]PCD04164.1 protein-disulfide isomerase [Sphingomonas spermidinifaciens]
MRFLKLLLALLLGLTAGTAMAQAKRDWRAVVTPTSTGTWVIGNPAAKVKLVEYLSYTCPHCADFVAESKPVLMDEFVRSGTVSLEVRHAVRDGLDLAAAMYARCAGPRNFAAVHGLVFANQKALLDKAVSIAPPPGGDRDAALRTIADGSGLTTLVRARLPKAPAACLTDAATRDQLIAGTRAAFDKIAGTPSFELDGELIQGTDWARLEPRLRAAGAR